MFTQIQQKKMDILFLGILNVIPCRVLRVSWSPVLFFNQTSSRSEEIFFSSNSLTSG